MLALTDHARSRLQQRGIPAAAVANLLDFGRRCHDHHGATIVFFDHRARNALARRVDPAELRRIEPHFDTYAVIAADGDIVTVGHRTRRIRR